jgi:hypothetical protein
MKSRLSALLLLCLASAACAQGEYFVDLSLEAKALSKELQANARVSEKRFDAGQDISRIPAWFVGTCHVGSDEYHVVAYFSNSSLVHIGVFHGDKMLADLWRFPFDARQFYVEGTKLMFAVRASLHMDTRETYGKVPREVVIDFAAIPKSRTFLFHGNLYEVTQMTPNNVLEQRGEG